MLTVCRCGCSRELHLHYSSSVHCSGCSCERYRPAWLTFWRKS